MKVGGSSVEVSLSPQCGKNDILTGTAYSNELNQFDYKPRNNFHIVEETQSAVVLEPIFPSHLTPEELKENYKNFSEIEDYFKFTVVRNPWDVLVSYFWWSFNNYAMIGEDSTSSEFCENIAPMPYDTDVVLRIKFQCFYESLLDFGAVSVGLKKDDDLVLDWFARFQQSFFLNEKIDRFVKFENLNTEMVDVCDNLGLVSSKLPKLKSNIRKSKAPYQNYYNGYMKDLVGDYFKDTIEIFGYKF